jgi:uncharacterized protein (TIGR02646 family)
MRFVDLRKVELRITATWRTTAKGALGALDKLTYKDRSKTIDKFGDIWATLKPVLESAANKKCWYCESIQARSDKAVDHFRPKNRVAGVRGSEGYWWLSFEWSNYRYSCTYCNSRRVIDESAGGKHDNFPIAADATRGEYDATTIDLDRQERPLLLDPTRIRDVKLLSFDVTDGSAVPAVTEAADPVGYKRVVVSIELYHLNEEGLRIARLQKMLRIKDLVNTAEKLPSDDPTYENSLNEIASSIRPDAEHSAAARAMLKSLRGSALVQLIFDSE